MNRKVIDGPRKDSQQIPREKKSLLITMFKIGD